jgi:hypothetical protein
MPVDETPGDPPKDAYQQVQAALFAGNKIEAIKVYRGMTGRGLKESKDFVEALEAELRVESPELFTAPPGGRGCAGAGALLLVIVATLAAAWQ